MSRFRKFLACADSHGALIDPIASQALLNFKNQFKPEILIHGGDAVDLTSMRKGATGSDLYVSLEEDVEAAKSFLEKFFEPVTKNTEGKLLMGNHEARAWRLQKEGTGPEAYSAKYVIDTLVGVAEEKDLDFFPYNGAENICVLGDFNIVHGIKHNKHAAASHAQIFNNVIHFHTHTAQCFSVPNVNRYMAYTCPALVDLTKLNYQINTEAHYKARNGWIYGFLDTETNKLFPNLLVGDSSTETFLGPDGHNYAKPFTTKYVYSVKPKPKPKTKNKPVTKMSVTKPKKSKAYQDKLVTEILDALVEMEREEARAWTPHK